MTFPAVKGDDVARIFAGIFGPLAFLASLVRGSLHGATAETALWTAWLGLLVFAAVGYVVGWIAGTTIEQSVSARIGAELAAQEAAGKSESHSAAS